MTRFALILLVAGMLMRSGVGWSQETTGPNLVQNPGFEVGGEGGLPADWSGSTSVYSRVTAPVHAGEGALQFVNADPEHYALCSQVLPLEPGKAYAFGVWVKTEDIQGSDTGATICLEWYGADGAYLGGSYPPGVTGTSDWTQVRGISGRVPSGATRCSVTCYVRKGMTGKAWFDDVEVRQWLAPVTLETMLLKPNYRGLVMPGERQAEYRARVSFGDSGLRPEDVYLRADLLPEGSERSLRYEVAAVTGESTRAGFSLQGIAAGDYVLRLALVRRSDAKVLQQHTWRLRLLTERPDLASYIGPDNNLWVKQADGDYAPFFPLGMYWSGLNEEQLRTYADSAFNCLMPYGGGTQEQLDLAHELGLKVIYSVKDAYFGSTWCPAEIKSEADERPFIESKVTQFRDHPALLAWYLNDELSLEYLPRLEAHQRWLEELDPHHPTWVVLYQVAQVSQYARTFDAIGTDPYPIPQYSSRRAADWTRQTVQAVGEARPVWMVPQVFNWATYRSDPQEKAQLRPPTLAEMQSMAWQCLVHGARGLIFYSFFDLVRDERYPFDERWPQVKQLAAEIKPWTELLLTGDRRTDISAREREWLHWTTRTQGGVTYLFVVNDEDRAHAATFALGRKPHAIALEGLVATGAIAATDRLRVDLAPHEVRIYRLTW